jgi:streptogramin lyase
LIKEGGLFIEKKGSYKKTEKIFLMDDKGISALIGIFLVLAISVIFAGIIQTRSVPEWNKEIEAEHFNTLYADTLDLRQAIERTAFFDLPKTSVVHASLDYPSRMFLQNPPKPWATISTLNDKKVSISYNGNITDVLNSCTIQIKEDYNYFLAPELIIEHGMIIGNVGQDNYIMDNPLMNKESIDLYVVECDNNSIGTTSSINIHLFPVRDIPVNNASITFTTDYQNLWKTYLQSINVNFDGSIENEITLIYSNATIRIMSIEYPPPCEGEDCIQSTPTPITPTPTLTPTPTPISRTYTLNTDFDEGLMTTLNHAIDDQLQINTSDDTDINYHFIWVPNSNLGTISKVDTVTGKEIGRYRVNSDSTHGGNPSRTTVDLNGDVWVGTRQAGTVVKIGDYESGNCLDRNADGVIKTSMDTNNDGNITGAELLDWGKDECVLYEVVLIPGNEGTFVPGTYTGSYDTNYVGVAPRGLAIDTNNNLWAGTYSTSKYFYIDGETGQIKKTIDLSSWGHSAYGAIVDKKGILWSANLRDHVLRINTSNLTDIKKISIDSIYGFCLDYSGHLFTAGFKTSGNSRLVKVDINGTNPVIMWNIPAMTFRGVVSTRDNNIWVAGINSSGKYNSVSRYDNNGTLIATISGFNDPSGVAVDEAGKVWVTDIGSNNILRIDPLTNTVDLTKDIIESGGHYTYSDMTGFIARTITTTTTIGNWTVIFDSGTSNIQWGTISWNSSEPAGTSVKVSVRTSDDQANWSTWKNVANGVQFDPMLNGRYMNIVTTLKIISGNTSPILYDLTVSSAN